MPGLDLTQLVDGIIYPNSTYYGNPFAPEDQYPYDTILNDQPFYPTEVDFAGVVWDGITYMAPANTPTYSGVSTGKADSEWNIEKLVSSPIDVTDITYANGIYVVTSTNSATPVFRSTDGVIWTSNGQYTPYDSDPYNSLPYDRTSLYIGKIGRAHV